MCIVENPIKMKQKRGRSNDINVTHLVIRTEKFQDLGDVREELVDDLGGTKMNEEIAAVMTLETVLLTQDLMTP